MKVRDITEKLRKDKEQKEAELNPLVNQFSQIKNNIELKKQEIQAIESKFSKFEKDLKSVEEQISKNNEKLQITHSE